MVSSDYKDNEKEFLRAMAVKFCFSGNTELAFFERLYNTNVQTWEQLAEDLKPQLIENAKETKNVVQLLKDCWNNNIYSSLTKHGYQFNGKNKWQFVRKWLIEVKYPEWLKEKQKLEGLLQRLQLLTISGLWEELRFRAVSTNKMGPVIPKVSDMNMYTPDSNYRSTIPPGTEIKFEVQLERPGYLTLLEKGTTGEFFCLSPSSLFAPYPNFKEASKVLLPMEGASIEFFELSSEPGVEEIIVAIAPERPKLDWLPKPDQEPLQLQGKHLQEFLVYFECESDCTLWYMNYKVV
ncbi:MAG: DUF4384 domain-containing protein [Okeania sp. SIO3B5]|uniref:DUF4384 domain-containing protein n=1 Tax=Okeania sp. SIO3B5 TaxID=2607811 RepID=UPI0013FFD1EF|nr:DUF4384 domain-containing protein [Okeania sp. SIO3B5]NEO53861.1 DUF4384 domain-containing protein [Okeania sp. SIO3B5]